jgi:hypothetical protein
MLRWLNANDLRIEASLYTGKPREDLLCLLRGFHEFFPEQEDFLRAALHETDWNEMVVLPAPVRQSSLPPLEDEVFIASSTGC